MYLAPPLPNPPILFLMGFKIKIHVERFLIASQTISHTILQTTNYLGEWTRFLCSHRLDYALHVVVFDG